MYTPDDERRDIAARHEQRLAADAFDDRIRALPTRQRIEAYRRANRGEDLRKVVAEMEAEGT